MPTWKATLVLLVATVLTAVLRKASAATRHLVWTAAFGALLALPFLTRVTPAWTATTPVNMEVSFSTVATRSGPHIDWPVIIWLLGVSVVLTRFLIGTARAWLQARRAALMNLDSKTRVLDAGANTTPMTWGIFRPVILLPSEAPEWPPERLRAVLLHEQAHVDRRDCLTIAISEIALALYWFHPLAWWGSTRMRREREQACDDAVLAAGVKPADYAGALVEIARSARGAFPAPAMARTTNLEARVKSILDPKTNRAVITARLAAVGAIVAIAILLPLATVRVLAQVTGLSGVVTDASGGVVVGADVVVTSETGVNTTVSTDAAGHYSFPGLPQGKYRLMARQPGFAPDVHTGVTAPGVQDIRLNVGQVREMVRVSGRRTAASPARPFRVGGNVQPARVSFGPKPVYPPRAEAAGIEGTVTLRAVIGTDGVFRSIVVVGSPDPELSEAAMDALRQWRCEPALLNGQPIEVGTMVSIDFRLDQ